MSAGGDEIRLTLPREKSFHRIAHLVLGGLAIRLDLTFETLEDLQLALARLLDRAEAGGEVTVSVRIDGDTIRADVGPFAADELGPELEDSAGAVSLRRVLDTVVDDVSGGERGGSRWVQLTKNVPAKGEG